MNLAYLGLKKRSVLPPRYCPITHKQADTLESIGFILQSQQVVWWQCPACGGWHVLLKERERKSKG